MAVAAPVKTVLFFMIVCSFFKIRRGQSGKPFSQKKPPDRGADHAREKAFHAILPDTPNTAPSREMCPPRDHGCGTLRRCGARRGDKPAREICDSPPHCCDSRTDVVRSAGGIPCRGIRLGTLAFPARPRRPYQGAVLFERCASTFSDRDSIAHRPLLVKGFFNFSHHGASFFFPSRP